MARKGSDQPIWLLVALLLAVVVGVALFTMINKGTNNFSTLGGATGGEDQRVAIEAYCKGWIRPKDVDLSGNLNPRAGEPPVADQERETDVFRKYGWLSAAKDPTTNAYVESGPASGCDCVVFLASSASLSLEPTRAKQFLTSESVTGSTYDPASCYHKAKCVGQAITELQDLFSSETCP